MESSDCNAHQQLVLEELGQRIRQIDKKLLSIQRERAAISSRPSSAYSKGSRPTTAHSNNNNNKDRDAALEDDDSPVVDPLLSLQTERGTLSARYEQLSGGDAYKPLLEHRVFDFCEAFYAEIERPTKDASWIAKYYSPDCHLNVVGLGVFDGRDLVVRTIVKKYDKLQIKHEIQSISIDSDSTILTGESRGAYIRANVHITVQLDDDRPRRVMEILEWTRSNELTPYDIVLHKEFFVVQDARPLYHWAERDEPPTKLQLARQQLAEEKAERERQELLRQQAEEEERRRKEMEDSEDEEDDEEEDEEEEEQDGNEDGDDGEDDDAGKIPED